MEEHIGTHRRRKRRSRIWRRRNTKEHKGRTNCSRPADPYKAVSDKLPYLV